VVDSRGRPVSDATVRLEGEGGTAETKSGTAGKFAFAGLQEGSYRIVAEKSGLRSRESAIAVTSKSEETRFDLTIDDSQPSGPDLRSSTSSSTETMQFADEPNFTIAGVTDWTAVGGHGSDSSLRTSEALARETMTLKPGEDALTRPGAAEQGNADQHRRAGELDEKRGDPLSAVREFEEATRLDPSEQNYFEWGSELLLHRAIWQAEEVFRKGVLAHPKSARMLTALGTALFAGARYDEAAQRLCDASDLSPLDLEPYIFMGKIQIAAPDPLTCIEQKLERFATEQPNNSLANYLYAMALLKRQERAPDHDAETQAEALLTRAVKDDPKCADAYLELGNLAAKHNSEKSIDLYLKSIEANPNLSEAHYRLGVAYDRMGESVKAKQEFQLHDQIEKQQAEEIERQRREIKQFLIATPQQTPIPPAK
jgi:Flp pilus assembly protein TadD